MWIEINELDYCGVEVVISPTRQTDFQFYQTVRDIETAKQMIREFEAAASKLRDLLEKGKVTG